MDTTQEVQARAANIAINITKLRVKKNLTPTRAAERAGMSLANWQLYELYGRLPRVDNALRIANALRVRDVREIWTPLKK